MAGVHGWSLFPVRHPATWEFMRGTLFGARPGSLMAAILVPGPLETGFSHAVTVSTGIRMYRPGWNAMEPGIDGD